MAVIMMVRKLTYGSEMVVAIIMVCVRRFTNGGDDEGEKTYRW
jgi:hypothetical protein